MIRIEKIACGLALVLVACGGKKDDGSAGAAASSSGDKRVLGAPIDAAAANAAVPAGLKDKITFEKRDIAVKRGRSSTTTYTVAVPTGWKQDMDAFANLKADDKGGFFSAFRVGSNCDGTCEPKDWEKISDKATFAPQAGGKVITDVKGVGTRHMIVESAASTKVTEVIYAWWKTGDDRYYTCQATLDESVKDAAPAFDKACSGMTVAGDD